MDAFLIALPSLLLTSISALPLVIGLLAAAHHLRAGRRAAYLKNLCGSIAAGVVALVLLLRPLFDDNSSSSSTASLIFVVVPVYAAVAYGIVYWICEVALGKADTPEALSVLARGAILVPLFMLVVLMSGLLKTSVEGNDFAVARKASNPKILHRLLEKSRTGEADAYRIGMSLAQNPNSPPEILEELAEHAHPAVRVRVAQHPMTPYEVVVGLSYDCSSFVRKAVEERLGPRSALRPIDEPTGLCAAKH